MQKNFGKIKNYLKLSAGAALAVTMVVLLIVRTNTGVAEWFATKVTPAFTRFFGRIFEWAEYSVFEFACFAAILAGVSLLVMCIIRASKKEWTRAASHCLSIFLLVMIISCSYVATAGMCYFRAPISNAVDMAENAEIDSKTAKLSADNFMNMLNAAAQTVQKDAYGRSVSGLTFKELSEAIREEYMALDLDYIPDYIPAAKKVRNSLFMSHNRIMGITFVPLGEVNINALMPQSDQAATIAHEMAHAAGVMRESEANLLAKYVLIQSNNPYLRYVGLKECIYDIKLLLKYSNMGKLAADLKIPDVVAKDFERERKFWEDKDMFAGIGEFFNDLYLKLQGQDGTNSYVQKIWGTVIGKDEYGYDIYKDVKFNQTVRMLVQVYSK